jgi:hypothetical protein
LTDLFFVNRTVLRYRRPLRIALGEGDARQPEGARHLGVAGAGSGEIANDPQRFVNLPEPPGGESLRPPPIYWLDASP